VANQGKKIVDPTPRQFRSPGEFYFWRTLITIATLVAILLTSLAVGAFAWEFGVAVFILLTAIFLATSLYYISADPPVKGIPMLFGQLVNIFWGAGWHYIPFRGMVFFNVDLKTGREISLRFTVNEIIPGDRSGINIPNEIYARIDDENPVPIVEMGGIDEAEQRLKEQVTQRERNWLCSKTEGPQDLDEARQMGDEAILMILEMVVGDEIRRIHPEITREALIGFLKHRTLTPIEVCLKEKFDALSKQEQDELMEDAKNNLMDLVNRSRNGQVKFKLPALGLEITRFGIANIEPDEPTKQRLAEANAAKFAAEKQATDAQSVREQAEKSADAGLVEKKEAYQLELIRRGIVKKEVKETRFDLSEEIISAGRELGQQVISAVFSGRKDTPSGNTPSTNKPDNTPDNTGGAA
jgi:regulator of protease activity HflC (stomatin/prohibitin superfamily)